jgi:hypothetical protein
MWYELAAQGILKDAPPRLTSSERRSTASIFETKFRDALAAKMTSQQIAEAKRLADEWPQQHRAGGKQ